MKNMKKFVAAFAAVAMVMSMGVSAFAEVFMPEQGNNMYEDGYLVLEYNSPNEAQVTMMAYLVDNDTVITDDAENNYGIPAYTNQTIIALDQNVGETGFGRVPVDTTNLQDKSIVVKFGGSNGDILTYLISLAPQTVTYQVVYQLDGGAGTNPATSSSDEDIAAFFQRVTPPTKDGYEFLYWSKTDGGEKINENQEGKMSALLDAGSADTVTLYAVYELDASDTDEIYYLGDIDGNGVVENNDIVKFIVYGKTGTSDYSIGQKLGSTNYLLGDIDGNGIVENNDIVKFIVYGKTGTSDYAIGEQLK